MPELRYQDIKLLEDAAKQFVSSRADANGLLTAILWGNVSINVLLALLSNLVMAGAYRFPRPTRLRVLLCANAEIGNLQMLFPMISRVNEIDHETDTRRLLHALYAVRLNALVREN